MNKTKSTELSIMCKEDILTGFEVLLHNVSLGTGRIHDKPRTG
jgi:hypothetical protein